MTQLCSWVVSSWRRCSYRPASARRSALAPFGFACYQGIALCRGLGRGGRGHRGARPNSPHSRYRAALDVFSPHRLCGDGNRNHTPVLGIRGCCGAPGAGDQFLQELGVSPRLCCSTFVSGAGAWSFACWRARPYGSTACNLNPAISPCDLARPRQIAEANALHPPTNWSALHKTVSVTGHWGPTTVDSGTRSDPECRLRCHCDIK